MSNSERFEMARRAFLDNGYDKLAHLAQRQPWLVEVARAMVDLATQGVPAELESGQNLYNQPPFIRALEDAANAQGLNVVGVPALFGRAVKQRSKSLEPFGLSPLKIDDFSSRDSRFHNSNSHYFSSAGFSYRREYPWYVLLNNLLSEIQKNLSPYPFCIEYISYAVNNGYIPDGSFLSTMKFRMKFQTYSRWLPEHALKVIEYRNIGLLADTSHLGYNR